MPEGPGRNSALDRSAQARVGRSVRPPAHVSRGAAEGSGAPFCLHRATEEQPGVCQRLPSLDLVSRDRGARLGRRRLEEPPSGRGRSRDTCVPVCRPYLPPGRNQAQRRGSGDQRGVREAPRPQPFWPWDEDCRTHREKLRLTRGSSGHCCRCHTHRCRPVPDRERQTLRDRAGSGWLLLPLHGPGLPCRAQPEMKRSFPVLGTVGLCLCRVEA